MIQFHTLHAMAVYNALVCTLVVLVHVMTCVSGTACTQDDVRRCINLLSSFDNSDATGVVLSFNKSVIEDMCRSYDVYSLCMNPIKSQCTPRIKSYYDGEDDAYQFLCKDGFNEYFKYQECYASNAVRVDANICNDTFTRSVARLQNESGTTDIYRTTKICSFEDTLLDCVQNAIKDSCGTNAALWHRTLDEKSLAPLLQYVGCPGWEDTSHSVSSSGFIITICVVLSLIAVLVVASIGIAVCYVARQRKNRLSSHHPRRAASGMPPPPPYSGVCTVHTAPGEDGVAYYTSEGATGVANPTGRVPVKMSLPPPYSSESPAYTETESMEGGLNVSQSPAYTTTEPMDRGHNVSQSLAYTATEPMDRGLNVSQSPAYTEIEQRIDTCSQPPIVSEPAPDYDDVAPST